MPAKKSTKRPIKKTTKKKRNSFLAKAASRRFVLFAVLFAFVGTTLLWRSFAATATVTYKGQLNSTSPSQVYAVSVGNGVLAATHNSKDANLRISILRPDGSILAQKAGSKASVSTNVTSGTYQVRVDYLTEVRGKKNYTLTISYPTVDGASPSVIITSPAADIVTGTINIQATASDDVGVTKVEFLIDAQPASTDTSSPYSHVWDTTTYSNGLHTLTAKAYDAAGNSSTASLTVTVSNSTPPPSGSNPSGEAMPVGDIPGWRQIFTDDFTTNVPLGSFPSAVSNKWGSYPYPWRDTKGQRYSDPTLGGWYYPEKVVSINSGMMDLWMHTETIDGAQKRLVSAPQPRIKGAGTSAFAGQLYGRYVVRFRSDVLPGYKTAWLLWPDSETWPRDGEIDFPEGDLDKTISGFMHWQGGTSGSDQYYALSGKPYTSWHTAVIEWGPNRCAFYLDGALITNAYGGKSEWTTKVPNTPMHWVLQTETALEDNVVPSPSTQGHVQIDWVAVYAPQ